MATDRTTLVKGPGTVKFGTVVLHDASGIQADIDTTTQTIESSVSGALDEIKTDQTGKVSLTPCGTISPAILAALYPHQSPAIGSSIMGGTDTALEIASVAGTKITFHAAALTKCPDLILSPAATAFASAAEFAALVAKGKAPADEGGLFTVATTAYAGGYPSNTGLAGCLYTADWGDLTITDTIAGWTITVELAVKPVTVDSLGTIDYLLEGVTVRAKCQPVGPTEATLTAALPAKFARGQSVRSGKDLTITGTNPGLTVVLKDASLLTGPMAWGKTELRMGEIGFVANRAFAGEVAGALYSVMQTAGVGE